MASSRSGHHHGRASHNSSMTRCGKCCYYCRQVTTFLFSHIGLCALLLGYALVGAFTFQALESQHEQKQRSDMIRTRDEMIVELSNMTNHSMYLNREAWIKNASQILAKFELKFVNAVKFKGYDGSDEVSKTSSQWSFSGALLYSIIVITTIGYGNVAPRTGKIVTIVYAIIGIPLMLFCLSNIGHAMAHSFKFIYWKCCCFLCVKPKKLERRQRRRRRLIRQQRQRAMMVLSQQQQHLTGGERSQANHNGSNHLPMTAPILGASTANHSWHRKLSTRSTLFRFPTTQSHSNSVIPTESGGQVVTDLATASSSFSASPAITPVMSNSNTPVFFTGDVVLGTSSQTTAASTANSSPRDATTTTATNEAGAPKKSNLSRSHSARYYNEMALPHYGQHQQANNQIESGPVVDGKDRASIICNKYASISDECIDAYRTVIDDENNNLAPNSTIKLCNPPRRTPSQVRFQKPDLNVCSPSPEVPSQPPPPFSDNAVANGDQTIPPPPFHPNYYHTEQVYLEPQPSNQLMVNSHNSNYMNQMNHLITGKNDFISDIDSDSEDEDITEKNIPITMCLTLVVGYICGGAWFFSTSEEWSFLDASYFCFVTLSTIGFGDLVPGRTVLATTPQEGQMTLAICALYLLFGMALLAMSLNLVKEKVTETVRIIGERIGILVNDDDDYY